MKNFTKLMGIGILGLCALAWGDMDHHHAMRPGSKEFEQLKQLAGTWQGTVTDPAPKDKPAPIATEFVVTAAGSAIEERLMPGTPESMVDMYTDEGGKLAMTHYCASGNQPHLVLRAAKPGQIALEATSAPGLNIQKDPHMHALVLEFPDANHLTEKWTSYENGKPGHTVVFALTRSNKKTD